MNLDDIRIPRNHSGYVNYYGKGHNAKSQQLIKQQGLIESVGQSISGKKYHILSSMTKSVGRENEEQKNSYFISLAEYQERKSLDSTQHRSDSQPRGSFDSQHQRDKRNLIYGNQSYKEGSQDLKNETSISVNNVIFEMVFFNKKKNEFNDSISTIGSFNKRNQLNQIDEQQFVKISDFKLGKKLGVGKFGEVFLAQHKPSGFICAIKRINKKSIDKKLLIQLIREIKIQSFLNHPNIVKLYTFFCDRQYIYLLLQLCYSGQIYEFLKKRRKLPQTMTKNIIQQTLKALDYMHQKEIIHRDIKPENIIFHNGMIKLCDFGWSISSKTMRETFCGTPLYVSPELIKRKNYNNKIDVWSVGILTYQLLFGRVPFQIITQSDFIKIVEDEIKFSKGTKISEEAKEFILICLKKDPRDRYTVPELLQHSFITNQEPFSLTEML